MTTSDEVLVCSGCGLPFRRSADGMLVHLEPWCHAMVSGEARPTAAKVTLVAEEAYDWQRIPPPPAALVAAFRDIIGAGREVPISLLWPEGGSDDNQ